MKRPLSRGVGIAFVVTIFVSELLKGDSPSSTGPAAEIATFLDDHSSTILAGAYVQMIALFLFALLLASHAGHLTPADSTAGRLGRLGLGLVLVAYTLYVFLTAAVAFGAGVDAGPEVGKALWEVRFVSETFVNFPAALLVGSVGVAAGLRPWYRPFSLAIALAFLVGGGALARNGFLAPDGGYGFILFWLLPLWVAVTAFVATAAPTMRAAQQQV